MKLGFGYIGFGSFNGLNVAGGVGLTQKEENGGGTLQTNGIQLGTGTITRGPNGIHNGRTFMVLLIILGMDLR